MKLKLRVAHSLIFSHLSYGYDIVNLTQAQLSQVNSVHATVLRTILHLPIHTSYDAMLYITGEVSLATLLKVRRVANLQRIRHLSKDTQLRKLYEQRYWHGRGYIFSKYEDDLREIETSLKLTTIPQELLDNELSKAPTPTTKKTLKKVCSEIDQTERFHRLRVSHMELLEGIKSSQSMPLLDESSLRVAKYAKWLTGATDTKGDLPEYKNSLERDCRLCGERSEETRIHLLTSCPRTKTFRETYFAEIEKISPSKAQELSAIPLHRQWVWILGAGTVREEVPDPISNNRIHRMHAGITAGKNVPPVKDKSDENECLDAFYKYLDILSELEREHIRIYTDGSHCPQTNKTGYGIRIVLHSLGRERVVHEVSRGLGEATINEAELAAVHEALHWLTLQDEDVVPRVPVHIFTDSKYTYNSATSVSVRRKNFHWIQEIQNFGHRLKKDYDIPFPDMHFVPSHIEHTAQGLKRTGNFYADRLATDGRLRSDPSDKSRYLHTIRAKTLAATLDLIDSIECILEQTIEMISCNPDGPSASADDLSASRLCQPGLSIEGPVT